MILEKRDLLFTTVGATRALELVLTKGHAKEKIVYEMTLPIVFKEQTSF